MPDMADRCINKNIYFLFNELYNIFSDTNDV